MFRRFGMVAFAIAMLLGAVVGVPDAAAKQACSCACVIDSSSSTTQARYEWTDLTSGRADCRADCAVACGGTASIVEGEYYKVEVACIPGRASDCTRSGSYAAYQGVDCALKSKAENTSELPEAVLSRHTNGLYPTCVIPVTRTNADIECARFGGVAAGGLCGTLIAEQIGQFSVSRPTLGGITTAEVFSQTNFEAYKEAVTRGVNPLQEPFEVRPEDGICYRYGIETGPSAEHVCFKRKPNICGTSAQPRLGGANALPQSFSCRPPSAAAGEDCFTEAQSRGLCAGSPGTLCCQGALSSCFTDAQCDFPQERCMGGTCTRTRVCDPENQDRQCRTAEPAEMENPEICSIEADLPSGAGQRCSGQQRCCTPPDLGAYSRCAADKLTSSSVSDATKAAYRQFDCVGSDVLPLTQFTSSPDLEGGVQARGAQRFIGSSEDGNAQASALNLTDRENAYTGNGRYHCLGSSVRTESGSRSRCTISGQVCCNVGALQMATLLEQRGAENAACGPSGKNFRCLAVGDIAAKNQAVGIPDETFVRGLAGRGVCQVTPLNEGSFLANQECTGGFVCCDATAPSAMVLCASSEDCGTDAVCDPVLGVCLAGAFSAVVTAQGDGCLDEAEGLGYSSVQDGIEARTGFAGEQFSCQFVEPGLTGAGLIGSHCIPTAIGACGATAIPEGLPVGTQSACCAPNTGFSPSVVAEAQGEGVLETAPFSLKLPACIKTGNCGLEDILYTGAQFANFLIQISGGIFLAIFVYGGFKYLTAGTSARAAEGKKMIIQASVAMVLILVAFTFVNFVQQSLIGATAQNEAQASCGADAQTANFACQFLASDPADTGAASEEVSRRGCVRNRCPGPENYLCCPL